MNIEEFNPRPLVCFGFVGLLCVLSAGGIVARVGVGWRRFVLMCGSRVMTITDLSIVVE